MPKRKASSSWLLAADKERRTVRREDATKLRQETELYVRTLLLVLKRKIRIASTPTSREAQKTRRLMLKHKVSFTGPINEALFRLPKFVLVIFENIEPALYYARTLKYMRISQAGISN